MDAQGFTERGRLRPCLSCTSLMKSLRSKLWLEVVVGDGALALALCIDEEELTAVAVVVA